MWKRTVDLVLSMVASTITLLLSWPYWRDFEFWPESRMLWIIYFLAGYVLAVYVFYVFLGALHTLFEHDALDHTAATDSTISSDDTEGQI